MCRFQQWSFRVLAVVTLAALMTVALARETARDEAPALPNQTAPETFAVEFETSHGSFVIEAYRPWAPNAADRFYNLVVSGYFEGNLFYFVQPTNAVKFGIHSDPARTRQWAAHPLPADIPQRRVQTGDVFLRTSTQVGIQTGPDSTSRSQGGYAPFGRVVEGLEVLNSLDDTHMRKPRKQAKMVRKLLKKGEAAISKKYPDLDSVLKTSLLDRSVELLAPRPADSEPPPADLPPGHGVVRVYRPDKNSAAGGSMLGSGRQNFNLRVDDELRAILKPGTVFEVHLPAGIHRLSSKVKFKLFATGLLDQAMAGRDKTVVDVEPGRVHYLRAMAVGMEGRTLALTRVVDDLGAEESRNLPPAKEHRLSASGEVDEE